MVNSVTDPTVELTPLDLLRYVEGDRPAGVIRLDDAALCVQFAYNVSCEYEYEAGESNYEMSPVLNARSIQRLVQMGAVRFSHVETDTRFFVVVPASDGREDILDALKEAFHAHDDDFEGFGGKDPRRVWNEYADEEGHVPKSDYYLPIER